ncbi:MAG: hypothetical protein MZV64_59330 [Ignavibacteriales bacterium]|nr:hypothetical protein [Ignavibacteriales bacterium]
MGIDLGDGRVGLENGRLDGKLPARDRVCPVAALERGGPCFAGWRSRTTG